MIDLSSLNENQRRAVTWDKGPILVLAGPGSGKTRVLTCRIAKLVEESPGEHFGILGLTFTDRAAVEMRRRVKEMVPDADGRVNLTTFHSFSAALLRQHGHHIGIRPDFTILSQEAERMAVLDEAIKKAGGGRWSGYDSGRLLPIVTRLTDQNAVAATAAEFIQTDDQEEAKRIGTIYGHYRSLMIRNNELDFGGLVAEALRLLTETAVGHLVRRIYTHICVDEFQDTNLAQYRILCSIVNPSTKNLFVVADDDQIIYGWNGADPERLESLRRRFGMRVLELPENYRCPLGVVEMANRLIANNPDHNKTNSIARSSDNLGGVVRVEEFDTAEEESKWIAEDIAQRPTEERRGCAVLARTRGVLKQVVEELEARGICGYLPVRKGEFVSDQMAWLHAMLRLANAKQDRTQLRRVCRSFFALDGVNLAVEDIVSDAAIADGDYLRAWLRAACRAQLDPATERFLRESVPRLADRLDAWGFIKDCFYWLDGYLQEADHASGHAAEYREEKDTLGRIVDAVNDEAGHDNGTLAMLLQRLDLSSKEPPVPRDAVLCYTVFASKGLEFDHVYLARLVEDELPDWRAIKKGNESREMQEERRVCFVAITRTQKSLTLTYPRSVSGYSKEPSRFLAEMGAGNGRRA